MPVGIQLTYHNNGQIATIGHYENERKEGLWRTYSASGELQQQTAYRAREEQ